MKHNINKNKPTALAVVAGGITAILITIIGAVIVTSVVNRGGMSVKAFKIAASIIWLISSFAGCLVSAMVTDKPAWIICGLCAISYIALLAAIQILCFDSGFSEILMPLAIAAAGCLPVILWNRSNRAGKRTKKHYRYR